ncbi:MAG: ferredoxin family protein [Albidovulum sp.]|nr:ferredoxin family protein [Albidovulum sp.]MDE0533301.1 ferredoxin family protein [Albidovulum sp.]
MTYVIAEPCVDVKDGDCLLVCPVDCIYVGGRMMYIQPDECVNCGICVSICPVDAIFCETKLPETWSEYLAINRDFFGEDATGWGAPGGYDEEEFATEIDDPRIATLPKREASGEFSSGEASQAKHS